MKRPSTGEPPPAHGAGPALLSEKWTVLEEIDPGRVSRPQFEASIANAQLRSTRPQTVAVHCSTAEMVGWALESPIRPYITTRYSLTDRRTLQGLEAAFRDRGRCVIVRDVLDSGRLNGTAWSSSLVERGRPTPPASIAELQARFAEIAPLGFLTVPGRRTLAQAAIRFALDHPGVLSVSLPLLPPREMARALASERLPSLTAEERERLETAAPGAGRDGMK